MPDTRRVSKQKPSFISSSSSITEEENAEIEATVQDIENSTPTISKPEFEEILKKYFNNLKGMIKAENTAIKSEIVNLQHEVESIKNENSNLKKQVDMNKSTIDSLKGETSTLKSKLMKLESNQMLLEEEIEERTNRQLRKTLVFRGIPEQTIRRDSSSDNAGRKENWDDTEELLAQKIAEVCEDTSLSQAREMIERGHRGGPNPNYQGDKPRPIFAAFYDWKQSEFVKKQFRINSTAYQCGNKYGARTSARRNLAMKERKRLKSNGTIISGYVDFPARLMVRDSNASGAKYYMKKDFSKDPVTLTGR